MVRAPETLAGRYELVEVIGRGGMGVVYRGRDRVLDRLVAVKVLPAEHAENPILVARFEREARAAARLNHPNIVAVYDTGTEAMVRYIVMECVPGVSLAQRLRERGPLEPPEAVEIAAQVASALGAAHAAGIVHRDIKPGNVMVEPSGTLKVLDFGIARATADAALTRTTMILGSAPYMAPEVALGGQADQRSDIYSLGCVLYEMLTGRPPFTGDLPAAVMGQHASAVPRSSRELESAVPPALDAVVMQMLAKQAEDRPQRAAELVSALRASLVQPAPAPPGPGAAGVPLAEGMEPTQAPRAGEAEPTPVAPATQETEPTHVAAPRKTEPTQVAPAAEVNQEPPPSPSAQATEPAPPPPPAEATEPAPPPPPRRSRRHLWIAAVVLIAALVAGVTVALALTSSSGSRHHGTSVPQRPPPTATGTPSSASTGHPSTRATSTTGPTSTTHSTTASGTTTSGTVPAKSSTTSTTRPSGASSTTSTAAP